MSFKKNDFVLIQKRLTIDTWIFHQMFILVFFIHGISYL